MCNLGHTCRAHGFLAVPLSLQHSSLSRSDYSRNRRYQSSICAESPILANDPRDSVCSSPATRIFAAITEALGHKFTPLPARYPVGPARLVICICAFRNAVHWQPGVDFRGAPDGPKADIERPSAAVRKSCPEINKRVQGSRIGGDADYRLMGVLLRAPEIASCRAVRCRDLRGPIATATAGSNGTRCWHSRLEHLPSYQVAGSIVSTILSMNEIVMRQLRPAQTTRA